MNEFGLYLVITDPVAGYAACAEAAVRAGVGMVQLRMKRAPRGDILRVAREMRAITAGTATRFIVNDDPSLAVEVGADGVHVGQDDLPPETIRRRYPELKIVGLSTHSLDDVRAAHGAPVDYIGVGPVYATPTKAIPDPTLGLETMAAMIAAAPCPTVAIGGIDATRLPAVLAAGAQTFAVVRAVCANPDPYSAICRLAEVVNRFKRQNPIAPDGRVWFNGGLTRIGKDSDGHEREKGRTGR